MTKEIIEKLKKNEMASINEDSVYIDFNYFTLFLGTHKFNDFMKLEITGENTLQFKSLEELLNEYSEDSEDTLREYYYQVMKKYGKELDKLGKDFDNKLDKILKNIKKDLDKIEDFTK